MRKSRTALVAVLSSGSVASCYAQPVEDVYASPGRKAPPQRRQRVGNRARPNMVDVDGFADRETHKRLVLLSAWCDFVDQRL